MRLLQRSLLVAFLGCGGGCASGDRTLAPERRELVLVRNAPPTTAQLMMWIDSGIRCYQIWAWGCEDDNGSMGLGPWSNPIKDYCKEYPESCDFVPTGGGGVANPVFPLGTENDDESYSGSLPPACPVDPGDAVFMFPAISQQYTWCIGKPLADTPVFKQRFLNALSRIRARGVRA